MKTLIPISFLVLVPGIAIAQTDRQATDNRTDSTSTREDNRDHHNYGWIGLLGLAGLAGLRRKSELHSQLESQGVNVKTVRT